MLYTSLTLGSFQPARSQISDPGMEVSCSRHVFYHFLYMQQGKAIFDIHLLRCLKSIQKYSDPSFFHTNTMALHQGLVLGCMALVSCISCTCCLTSSTKGGGILWKHSSNKVSSSGLMSCSMAWVHPSSLGLSENTLWYFQSSLWASSALSVGQASKPTRSIFSISFCHCFTVKVMQAVSLPSLSSTASTVPSLASESGTLASDSGYHSPLR